jgi:Nucleotidyl transferase AbiEii toxin, Type IV TA system
VGKSAHNPKVAGSNPAPAIGKGPAIGAFFLPAEVRCYGFEELFAEKIRAMGERSRPRDLYDIVNLFRREDLRLEQS